MSLMKSRLTIAVTNTKTKQTKNDLLKGNNAYKVNLELKAGSMRLQ
jgi:hypothetical protein